MSKLAFLDKCGFFEHPWLEAEQILLHRNL